MNKGTPVACKHRTSRVSDSRPSCVENKYAVYRRRRCHHCGEKFTTYEMSHEDLLALRWEALNDAAVRLLESAFLSARGDLAATLERLRQEDSSREWGKLQRTVNRGAKHGQR